MRWEIYSNRLSQTKPDRPLHVRVAGISLLYQPKKKEGLCRGHSIILKIDPMKQKSRGSLIKPRILPSDRQISAKTNVADLSEASR
jgi:hypothetical protein